MYGELLVLYNTVFNFVLLAFTCEVSRLPVHKGRLFASACASGLVAVLLQDRVMMDSVISFIVLIVVAFGFRLKNCIRKGIVVWIAALFLGGILLLVQPILHELSSTNFLVVSSVIAIGMLTLFYRSWNFERRQRLEKSFVRETTLLIEKNVIQLLCYVDTGNVCSEPLSGKPVHFVAFEAVATALPYEWRVGLEAWDANKPYDVSMLPTSLSKRVRFIQLATVQTNCCIALAIRFDQWIIDINHTLYGEYVVVTRNASNFPSSTEAILHVSALVNYSLA